LRVVICERPGPPGVLRIAERPVPKPGPREVLIEVAYAAIAFVETQVRAGVVPARGSSEAARTSKVAQAAFPLVLGNAVAGTVVKVGPEVDPRWTGERVVASTGGSGGYAEYALAPEKLLHLIPAELDAPKAVALLADGRTALALARAARLKQGDRVLITAAAGGVGSLLVQLARAAGAAIVVGLAGGEKKLELARSLGAHAVIDYRRPGWERAVWDATRELGVDVAFDGVGGATGQAIVNLVAKGGRYLPHGMASGEFYDVPPEKARDLEIIPLRSVFTGPDQTRALVEEALRLAASGRIRPVIGQVFPLERAAEAHAAIEARRTLGKTLLAVRTGVPPGNSPLHPAQTVRDTLHSATRFAIRANREPTSSVTASSRLIAHLFPRLFAQLPQGSASPLRGAGAGGRIRQSCPDAAST